MGKLGAGFLAYMKAKAASKAVKHAASATSDLFTKQDFNVKKVRLSGWGVFSLSSLSLHTHICI